MYVMGIDFNSAFIAILLLDFGTVLTVWCFFVFHILFLVCNGTSLRSHGS
jgi:hypothetical protein